MKSKYLFLMMFLVGRSHTAFLDSEYKLKSAIYVIPHIDKRDKGGEDASWSTEKLMVVADGVGGWASHGIDPALYSKELVENIKSETKDLKEFSESKARDIIVKAASRTKNIGSSTCCLLIFDEKNNTFYSANIGDSGYIILRLIDNSFQEYVRSDDQSHSFNFPYQIGTHGDSPTLAETNTHQAKNLDIVILGTDGLWDNLEVEQILRLLRSQVKEGRITNLLEAAKSIAEEAERLSNQRNYLSPFAKKARENKKRYMGGKPDDITVVVAQLDLGTKINEL